MRPSRLPLSLRGLRRIQPASQPISAVRHTPSSLLLRHSRSTRTRPFSSTRSRFNQGQFQSRDGGDPVKVQVVHSSGTSKRLALLAFYLTATLIMVRYLKDVLNEAIAEVDETEAAEEDDEQPHPDLKDPTFITLYPPKELPRRYYKDSDEDWHDFATFSRDPVRKNEVRQELAELVLAKVSRDRGVARLLGDNIRVTQHWLDFKFPDAPPPEFQRFGIEITDQFISLKTQTIPNSHYHQLQQFFWPKAVFRASYKSLWVFYRIMLLRVKSLAGVELNQADRLIEQKSLFEQRLADIRRADADISDKRDSLQSENDALEKQLRDAKNKELNPPDSPPSPSDRAVRKEPTVVSEIWTRLQHPRPIVSHSDTRLAALLSWVPAPPLPPPRIMLNWLTTFAEGNIGWRVFASFLNGELTQSKLDTTPKGAFYVVGTVEISGQRARASFEVLSAYNPRRRHFEYEVTALKHVWEHSQAAKGGP